MSLSHFDEKSGVIKCETYFGSWWQTLKEVHIVIDIPKETRAKDVRLVVTPKHLKCVVHDKILVEGDLFETVHGDDHVWTIESDDKSKSIYLVLSKAVYEKSDRVVWHALMTLNSLNKCQPDLLTFGKMRRQIDLECFQIENPGMDFSRAKLSKSYDRIPDSYSTAVGHQSFPRNQLGYDEEPVDLDAVTYANSDFDDKKMGALGLSISKN